MSTTLPAGTRVFHPKSFLDYQFKRLYGCGFADEAELLEAAGDIRVASEAPAVFRALSERAEGEGRLRAATAFQRGAEFFTGPTSVHKRAAYERYRDLFDRAFADEGFVRHEVPYAGAMLPAYLLPSKAEATRGTVLVHGGFDSLIEEFFAIWERIAEAGFDVVSFEGPGQGGPLNLAGLPFDHDWEGPVGAVLDHLELEDVTLVGISMGGYWAIRAAAYEPRISRVVAWPPVYDWMFRIPPLARRFVFWMVGFRRCMNWSIRLRMRLFPVLGHAVNQAMYLAGGHEPMQAVDWLLGMNHQHISSDRVTQDVLILIGENDAFQPAKLARYQMDALVNARSIQARTFTASEQADGHCQMSNLGLACSVLTHWLRTGEVQPPED